MTTICWPHCAGQRRIKEVLEAAVVEGSLSHAYLFSGMEGCGKFAAALDLALILLCEDKNCRPCMKCDSCRKVLNYSHPDFHVVVPVDLPRELKGDAEGENEDIGGDEEVKNSGKEEKKWVFISDRIQERIKEVYLQTGYEKKPDIPVGWIRGEFAHAISRGTIGKSFNIVILDGIDLLKAACPTKYAPPCAPAFPCPLQTPGSMPSCIPVRSAARCSSGTIPPTMCGKMPTISGNCAPPDNGRRSPAQ
jgi:DNA polymerase III delta prime subunit